MFNIKVTFAILGMMFMRKFKIYGFTINMVAIISGKLDTE